VRDLGAAFERERRPFSVKLMPYALQHGTVRHTQRRAIHVLRVQDSLLEPWEADDLMSRLRRRLKSRGEVTAEVVLVQGDSKETLRLFGQPYSISRVRAAMFNAEISWSPVSLD
jgi:translation initiation factor 1 (eIF-1/SUI1)